MRLRLVFCLVPIVLAVCGSASAAPYPWPVRPFDRQHPVRANFGDPRTIFENPLFSDGIEGPGSFLFHNGIDISARDGTAVYPVVSGVAKLLDSATVGVTTGDHRSFQYFHLVPLVTDGEQVVARRTMLGYVMKSAGHVHLTEIRGDRVTNPLAKGGIAPYRDTVAPHVSSIVFRTPPSLHAVDPLAICGRTSIVTDASDTPQLKVPGSFAGFPVSPALVTWFVRRVTGPIVMGATAVDFRGTLPLADDFWNVYARGTYQNAPRFGPRQFALMPGRFLYNLTPEELDTRSLPNGIYQVTVRAVDIRGNAGSLSQRFTVTNVPGSETGCPPAPPPKRP